MQYLREQSGSAVNKEEFIRQSYDLQAGTAIEALSDPAHAEYLAKYSQEIARLLREYGPLDSLLEAGVGEATTLAAVLRHLQPEHVHGFDISGNRLLKAEAWLHSQGIHAVSLIAASLECMPYPEEAFEAVYTSHAIEPNGGREEPILRELYRVTRRILLLLEPAYELASEEAQARMRSHGYCRDLAGCAQRLGYRVLRHELFPVTKNPLNPTGLVLIAKS